MLSHKSMKRDGEKVLLPCVFLKLVSPKQKQLSADSLGLNLFSLKKSEVNWFPTLVQLVAECPAAPVRAHILSAKTLADTIYGVV